MCVCTCEGVGVSKRGVPNNRNEVCKVFDTCEKDVDARIEKNRKQQKKKKGTSKGSEGKGSKERGSREREEERGSRRRES